jgi:hypothetical protein
VKHTVRMPLWLFLVGLGAGLVTTGAFDWQWHAARRDASEYREALRYYGVSCERGETGLMICVGPPPIFHLDPDQPARAEGDDQ